MARTKVSSKYQVVIPKDVRRSADVRVGREFQVIAKGGQITLVPDKPADAMMLAFARENRADLVTTDSGFEGLPRVTVFSNKTKT